MELIAHRHADIRVLALVVKVSVHVQKKYVTTLMDVG